MENIENMLRVGVISKTHGLKGEVKVFPTTDDNERFKYLKTAYIVQNNKQIKVQITGVKFFKNLVILKFKEFDDINDVEKYKGSDLMVTREDALPLKEGEHFITDLIGLNIITEDDEKIGILKDVMKTGANDVYVVETLEKEELLLPVIPDCVKKIDLENKVITVHLMEGLL